MIRAVFIAPAAQHLGMFVKPVAALSVGRGNIEIDDLPFMSKRRLDLSQQLFNTLPGQGGNQQRLFLLRL